MTMYMCIDATTEPYDAGLDEQKRQVFKTFYIATKDKSTDYLREIAQLISDAGIGTIGEDLFWSAKAGIAAEGTVIVLTVGVGLPPLKIHNKSGTKYYRPGLQVFVHADKSTDASTISEAINEVLVNVKNQDVVAA